MFCGLNRPGKYQPMIRSSEPMMLAIRKGRRLDKAPRTGNCQGPIQPGKLHTGIPL